MRVLFLISWLAFTPMGFGAPAPSSEKSDPSKAYQLIGGLQYLALKETSGGSIFYEADTVKTVREKSEVEINHKRHTAWGEDVYVIWNFAPVGVGLQFRDEPDNSIAAEWEMDYRFRDYLALNPKFTGKQKGTWSPLLGHELQLSYKYHYQHDPKPSYWDIVLRGSLVVSVLESLRFGAYFAPEQFRMGVLANSEKATPFPYRSIYTTGLWTELVLRKTLALQVEGGVGFCEERKDTFTAKYTVASTLGFYF